MIMDKRLPMEVLDAIARKYIEMASKTEKGREMLRRFASGEVDKTTSMLDQIPEELADSFTEAINEVYESLIKPDDKECQGS